MRIYRSSPLFLNLSMCSSTVHLAPITHTNLIGSTYAIYGEADHAPRCTYRFLSLPICPLNSHNIALSHCFSACSDDALNPPCIIPSATRSRRHAFVAGVAMSTSCHYLSSLSPNTSHCPLFIVHDGPQDQANRRGRQARAQRPQLAAQKQPQRCCNYNPSGVARPIS